MRPETAPETRSRRQSDPHQVPRVTKLTRLTNGFASKDAKDDHVTTRSQAKSCKYKKNRLSKTFKQKLSPSAAKADHANSPTTASSNNNDKYESKNKISSRLNGIINSGGRGALVGKLENLEERKLGRDGRLGRNLNCNGLSHGKNSSNQTTTTTGNASQLLFTHHRYQNFDKNGGPKTEKERVALQRAVAAEKRADRAKKRRSALWVLNCEAESFLFGETAAEDHEVELPPLSPPKKRRRIRANELGTLLKEGSIIGSKLRSPTPQPTKEQSTNANSTSIAIKSKHGDNNNTSTRSPPAQKNNSKKLFPDLPVAGTGKDLSVSLRVNVDDSSNMHHHNPLVKDEILPLEPSVKEDELTSISSPLSSVYSSMGSPNSLSNLDCSNSNSHSVRIQSILSSMDLRFSFEDVPTDEVWYSTFQRQEHPETSTLLTKTRSYDYYNYGHAYGHNSFGYFSPCSPPALLPYETKLLNQPRSLTRGRMSRLPRKSPRCHASTLAILSSLKRGRHRNSVLLPQSPALPPSSPKSTTTPISCHPSPASTIAPTPTASSNSIASTPTITIAKPDDEDCKNEKNSAKQSVATRKLSKKFCKAKVSRFPHRNNKLSTLQGKNSPSLSPTSSSLSPSSQNQLTVNSYWRLGSNKSSTLPPVSPPMLSSRPQSPSPSPTSPDKCPHRIRDISATQYLWDSIQLLSDPYVIQVLAGEKTGKSPTTTSTITTTNNNNTNNHTTTRKSSTSPQNSIKSNTFTLKSKGNQLLLRNSSSKKDQDKDVYTDQDKTGQRCCGQHADNCTNLEKVSCTAVTCCHSFVPSSNSQTTKNSKLIPTPKSSPKNNINNNVNHKNYINGVQLGLSSNTRHCKYKQAKVSSCPSPQSSPNSTKNAKLNNSNSNQLHHHHSCNNNRNTSVVHSNSKNGLHAHYPRKSPRKSPIVLVSDIFKGGNMQSDGKTTLKSTDVVAAASSQYDQSNNNGMVKTGREQLLFLLEGIP